MEEKERELKELEEKITGDMWADMELMDKIHNIKNEINGVQNTCSIDGGECENCGS